MGSYLRRTTRGGLAFAALALLAVGCSSNPPCTTPTTEVQTAQEQAMKATKDLDGTKAERQRLDDEIKKKEQRIAELKGKPAQLEKELAMLKKGSGR